MVNDTVFVQSEQEHNDTLFRFVISCQNKDSDFAEKALFDSNELISHLETELSLKVETSSTSRFNTAKTDQAIPVSTSFMEIFKIACEIQLATNGKFAVSTVGNKRIIDAEVDTKERVAHKQSNECQLDFSTIFNGYALDQVASYLLQCGLPNFLLSAGNTAQFISGFAANGTSWKWIWAWDENPNNRYTFEHHAGVPIALGVATASSRSHILTDRQRAPLNKKPNSSVVTSESATKAVAYATALLETELAAIEDQCFHKEIAMATLDTQGVKTNSVFTNTWGSL